MGNWHCATSDCARVIYREYLPPSVRWRYSGENWQEIRGDDFSVATEKYQCPISYRVLVTTGRYKRFIGYLWTQTQQIINLTGPIDDIWIERLSTGEQYRGIKDTTFFANDTEDIYGFSSQFINTGIIQQSLGDWYLKYKRNNEPTEILFQLPSNLAYRVSDIDSENDPPDDCGDCTFTITLSDEIVHTEIRDTCPEVEILPCRLSDVYKEIKIDKVPYLSAIEVVPFARDAEKINGVPFPLNFIRPIPSECLNIYRNELFDPLPSGLPSEENEPGLGDYITQICSAPGCPPPEYEVICDCVERCPPNTCSVVCGSNICCYDSDGIAQKSIPISSFFPTNTTGGNPR